MLCFVPIHPAATRGVNRNSLFYCVNGMHYHWNVCLLFENSLKVRIHPIGRVDRHLHLHDNDFQGGVPIDPKSGVNRNTYLKKNRKLQIVFFSPNAT